MATTTNPQLTLNTTVYAVVRGNKELGHGHNGATFIQAVIVKITWNDSDNQYHYELAPVGSSDNFWMSENKYNNASVGEYLGTNQNNARTAFRNLVNSYFP